METCVICFDDFREGDDGVKCCGSDPHFVCNECFVGSVRSLMTDELSTQDLRKGKLACPLKTFPHTTGSCDAPCFDDRLVATKLDAPTFEEYLQVRNKLMEAKLAREADAEMERKVSAAVRAMQKEGVEVFETYKHIVDDILTMRCPRCKMAFADWDGCNAVYCTYAGCGCNFCPFCLKDCGGGVKFGQREIVRAGDDAVHRHIQSCENAKGIGIGVNDGRVQRDVWNRIRKQRIEKCLKEKCSTAEQQQKVLDKLKTQLDELGLAIRVPQGAAAAPPPPPPPVGAPVPKAARRLGRARCRYGGECNRKNSEHRQTYAHPGDADWEQAHDSGARSSRAGA